MKNLPQVAVVTAAHNDSDGLTRLRESLVVQTLRPVEWLIVENGLSGAADHVKATLACVRVVTFAPQGDGAYSRPTRIPAALQYGFDRLTASAELVCVIDADVSLPSRHFLEGVARAFAANARLGIASGRRVEWVRGRWRRRGVTWPNVEPQCRAYRRTCLEQIVPLEIHMAWDTLDVLRAKSRGWQTELLPLDYTHHRGRGARARSSWAGWREQGDAAHYLRYRPTYVLLRSARHARVDFGAFGFAAEFLLGCLQRRPQLRDKAEVELLRRAQRARHLIRRRREAKDHLLESECRA